jgi:alkylhydroperoxidase family enzyme
MRKGLTEAEVQAALGDLDTAALPPATVAALRLADRLTAPQPAVDAALLGELRRHYDDGQILELGVALSVGSGWQRFIEAFGVRPDAWTPATPLPWPAAADRAP